jgi:hypothetical protein
VKARLSTSRTLGSQKWCLVATQNDISDILYFLHNKTAPQLMIQEYFSYLNNNNNNNNNNSHASVSTVVNPLQGF